MIDHYTQILVSLKIEIQELPYFANLKDLTENEMEEYFDYREIESFEKQWLTAFDKVTEMQSGLDLPNDLINEIREIAFKKAYDLTQIGDLAAFCSDDFELIAKNLCFEQPIPFISKIHEDYKSGKLPT